MRTIVATGLALAVAAGFTARALWPGGTRPAASATVPVSTATVARTDVSARQVVAGTLGYQGTFGVIGELGQGIVTWLPAVGSVVGRGQILYQVSGQPAILLYGPVPAWRDFGPGMTAGPDVRELQRNLAVLGFAPGSADGVFGWSTEAAIERWQQARGLTVTGTIPLGEVAFLPGPLRVTSTALSLGSTESPGTAVLSGTSDTPVVSVWLTAGGTTVQPGDPVLVTLPNGTTTVRGTVASLGRVAVANGTDSGTGSSTTGSSTTGSSNSGSSSAQNAGAGAQSAAIPVTVTIAESQIPAGLDQAPVQVAITQAQDRDVLAVPVTALLALPGGSYAVRLSGPRGRVIPVTTGLFDDATGLVEIAGRGLAAGQIVEVAQS